MATITLTHDVDVERRGDGSAPADNEGDFRDTQLQAGAPDAIENFTTARCGATDTGKDGMNEFHGLVLYDLLSFIPAGAIITNAIWHFKVHLVDASAGQTFIVKRGLRTDWVETEATWNSYKSGSPWTTPGGDMVGSESVLGDVTTTGWKSAGILTVVQDAWRNLSGICTFFIFRRLGEGTDDGLTGTMSFFTKNAYAAPTPAPEDVNHLRITYTLAGKTFQAFVH